MKRTIMPAEWLSGKLLSDQIQDKLQKIIKTSTLQGHRAPKLTVILVGEDPASKIYVNHKIKACEKTGILSELTVLDKTVTENDLLSLIHQLNVDSQTDGILVQMPLPSHISKEKIIEAIDPAKDVDGFHPTNLGKLAQGHPFLRSCTPFGIIKLLNHYDINLKGIHAVILGASTIVGRPLLLELINAGSTVTICNSKTKDLAQHVKNADLLISATGKRGLVQSEWIKTQAVIVDVGIHRLENNQICGDLDSDNMLEKASFITPVPGGVGPMTVAVLLENTVFAYQRRLS
jgi:methylenetetrahydrofolate dehydrogenase (NADP+)/methenyltetrahydrofolate cyclohydrolase